MYINLLFTILALLVLSALVTGTEVAFVSANKLKIELDKNKGSFSAHLLSWLFRQMNMVTIMLLFAKTVLLIFLVLSAVNLYLNFNLTETYSPATTFLIPVFIFISLWLATVLLSDLVPKILFRLNPNGISKTVVFPILILHAALYPILFLFVKSSEWFLHLFFGINVKEKNYRFSTSDIDHFIREFSGENEEINSEPELQMLQNAIDFKEVKIRECMIPRTEILGIELQSDIHELKQLFVETGHSKLLVYENSIDNIIGYVHSNDLFNKPKTIKAILRSIILAPETMQANILLRKLIKQNQSIAVVLDEFGGTSGIITMEDLMEEIFGEIEDEFDTQELLEKKIDEKTFLFSARIEIDYLNEHYAFGIKTSEDYETLAGYIIYEHRSIPQKGEKLKLGNFEFDIVQANQTKIISVRMQLME